VKEEVEHERSAACHGGGLFSLAENVEGL
jgi:hypothetical protein